ncbi:MAG: 3-isopropylmalate dehydratase [Ignavibacteriae bacterium]|nr:3-isopropylmalate dehydratase [Ignavibacteriota bacterium]NOG98562.1 3-isopropylmalate dehydratase [Ignavibacteriota bacterium]
MNKKIIGKAYILGDNIDTDQIIPAEHLVYSMSDTEESKLYGKFALSSVPPKQAGLPNGNIPFIEDGKFDSEFSIIIGGSNFGCGSSREHAPYALQKAGVKAIVAESYARIFYRNSVDGGYLVPIESAERLIDKIKTGDNIEIDFENHTIKNLDNEDDFKILPVGDLMPIVEAGGLFEYARKSGMI